MPAPAGGYGLVAYPERLGLMHQVRARLHDRTWEFAVRVALAGILGVLVFLLIGGNAVAAGAMGRNAGTAAAGVFCGLAVFLCVCRLFRSGVKGAALMDLMSRSRHCVVCEYDMMGLPAAEDGCTACPECGAAWRFEGATAERE